MSNNLLRNFERETKKSKTLRVGIKKCIVAASSTSVFLFSLIESFFCDSDTKVFKNVNWSNVAKTPIFQNWVNNFLKDSIEFREKVLDEFAKLNDVICKNLRSDTTFSQSDMEDMSLSILKKSTEPPKMVKSMRLLADVMSHFESVSGDNFHSKAIERKMTNLQIRIDELESKAKC
jgi:hypothetical protein